MIKLEKKNPTSFLRCMWNSLLEEAEVRLKIHLMNLKLIEQQVSFPATTD